MAIVQLSIDQTISTVKSYQCLPTDDLCSYPVNCGAGSTMSIIDAAGILVGELVFDGVGWAYTSAFGGIESPGSVLIVATHTITLDMENKREKTFIVPLKYDIAQVETAVVVGSITLAGDATVTVTIGGADTVLTVPVLLNDTAAMVATKIKVKLNGDAGIAALYEATTNGVNVILTKRVPSITDATLNIAYTNDTCTGLTPDATSNGTTAGGVNAKTVTLVNVPRDAQATILYKNIANPTITYDAAVSVIGVAYVPVVSYDYIAKLFTLDGGTTIYMEQLGHVV